ncbi:MAG TPA: ABC transporter permease [Methylomirabilota bacterium]|nr:ABC transporter permease [Methylomirabilota bacterium]
MNSTRDNRAGRSPRRRLGSVAISAAIAVVWEGGKALFAIPGYKLPHLHEILGDFLREGAGGERWFSIMAQNAGYTALESLIGFTLGGLTGLVLAIGFTHSRLLERGLLPYVVASQTVPVLAIAPMVVVWLGTSWFSKAVIAAYLTFFPVTINMARGLRAIDPDALALMRALAATSRQVFVKLRFPASLPYLFTALRISATASVIGAIVGELPVGSRFGMGVVIINAAQYYNWRPANLWAAILVSALIGIAFYHAVVLVERRMTGWRPSAPAI